MERLPERYGLRIDAFTASVERLITCESTPETKPVGVSKSSQIRRKVAKYRYLLVRGGLSVYQRRRVERQLAHNERKLDALANRVHSLISDRVTDVPIMTAPYARIELNGCLDREIVERVKRVQIYCVKCKRSDFSRCELRAIKNRLASNQMATCPMCDGHEFRETRVLGAKVSSVCVGISTRTHSRSKSKKRA